MSCLALYVLGPPEIECDGVPVKPNRRKAVALLVYLAMTGQGPGGRSYSRDSLATLLWPEQGQSRARAGLRRALASLRKALGEGWADGKHPLDVDREGIGLNPAASVWLDVAEFREKLDECQTHGHLADQWCPACLPLLTEAAALYRDDFLAGFTLRDSPAFDDWQFFQTQELRDDLARALERLARGHGEEGEFEPAIAYARRWVALDPLHEPAHRCLMQLYARSDQRAAALRQYSECERVLQEELGVPPSEETTQLYQAIHEGRDLPPVLDRTGAPRIGDRFEIRDPEEDLLGQGSMGDVYRATDTYTGETVAVKALDPRVVARNPGILERFVREGEALRQLDHPNIVRMVAAVEEDGQHYLVMEYVAGGSLHDLLESQRPDRSLPVARVLEIALDLADALTRAHRLGIIHRDLKPSNVLLAEDGTPRLSDFGIVRVAGSPRMTQTGILMGTVDYLSPEVCEGEALDERADIWSFGVMLYEMLAGERPFGGKSLSAALTAILSQPVPDLAQLCPDAPDVLVDLVYRMLEKDRQQRISSVRLVGAELEAILKGREAPTPVRLAPGESRFAAESRSYTPTPPAAAPTQLQIAHNLPAQLTSFVGRERETAEVVQLLETTRLLTLTGPPGTGKTRLGLHVTAEVLDQFEDGVFFVDLAPIRDPGLVATTIAQVLGIEVSGRQSLSLTLKNYLRHKHLLLLLDNFEQVIDAAPLVGELLSSSPGLKALVTSREALRVYGEQEYPVPPLTLPDLDRAEPLRSLSQYEAVELFVRRSRAVRPDFSLTEDNAPAVAEICVRLDGLPLAIELAAARSTMLSPKMMSRRLESRLGLLVAGPRDVPARQRTLRGTIDWSYDLLDPPEQTLFARLAVFQGGRSLEAVEAVCSQGLTMGILEGLESLLNKNLLRRIEGAHEEPRFVMLEMIHEYAWERLEASGEAEDLQRRHAEFFLALAERARPELRGSRYVHWSALLEDEHSNFRTALAWALGGGDAELGLQLAGALGNFWLDKGHSAEGLAWTKRALEIAKDAAPALRARALSAAGSLFFEQVDHKHGRACDRDALALYRAMGDEARTARALISLSLHALGSSDECKEGIRLCEEGLELLRKLGDNREISFALNSLGELARFDGDYERADRAYQEAVDLFREEGSRLWEAITFANRSYVAYHQGNYEQAEAIMLEVIAVFQELEHTRCMPHALSMLAGPVAAQGNPGRAAKLLGAAEAVQETLGHRITAGDLFEIERYVAAVREQLDEATFDAAWAEGRAMSLEQAVSYALEVGQPGPPQSSPEGTS